MPQVIVELSVLAVFELQQLCFDIHVPVHVRVYVYVLDLLLISDDLWHSAVTSLARHQIHVGVSGTQ